MSGRRTGVLMIVAALLAGAGAVLLMPRQWLFVDPAAEAAEEQDTGRRYACPMLCTIRRTPGKCPVCEMDMTEIQDTGETLPLSAYERRMIGLRTAEVSFSTLWRTLRTVGRVETAETRVRHVSAWIDGRIDRLFADYTGYVVKQGDPLFEVYSPELYGSQQDLLSALRSLREARDPRSRELHQRNVDSTRNRLRLLGLGAQQVEAVETAGEARTHFEVLAPIGGTLVEKKVVEGQYVKEGSTLAVVADLTHLWIKMDVFEEDLPWIRLGQQVQVTTRALPTRVFQGTITFIEPVLDATTRSVPARVELANEGGELRPGMFAEVAARVPLDYGGRPHLRGGEDDLPKVLAVPDEAVLSTGTRQLVYVMTSPPRYVERADGVREEVAPAVFSGREVETGPLADGFWPILSGLRPGELVATRGNFLVDSQMQLAGKASLMQVPGGGGDGDGHEQMGH